MGNRHVPGRPGATIRPYPLERRLITDAGWLGARTHRIHGFGTIDVTRARQLIAEQGARAGGRPSFTAFAVHCLGTAVGRHADVQAYRDWRGRLVLFDDVDVTTMIEVDWNGRKFPRAHVIRGANRRSVSDIQGEIRRIQQHPSDDLGGGQIARWSLFLRLPAFVRRRVLATVRRMPWMWKRIGGTVNLTAIGMFAGGDGWGIGQSGYPLNVLLGGIEQREELVGGRPAEREILHFTVSFDHDVVDGAAAARFARTFRELVEAGEGLGDAGRPPVEAATGPPSG